MSFDLEKWLATKRPQSTTCALASNPDLVEAHARAEAAVNVARAVVEDNPTTTARAALDDAEEALSDAEEAVEAVTTLFRFEGLSAPEWDALMDDHPPTADQARKARKAGLTAPVWNEDTLPAALIAACCVEPKLSVEDAQRILADPHLNAAEAQSLFVAARDACRTRRVPQLGKGSGRTLT